MLTKLIALAGLIFVGMAGWQLGGRLSSDAIGMALGVLFGIMAGIPASLMVLAAKRSDEEYDRRPYRRPEPHYRQQQPPVIIVTGRGVPDSDFISTATEPTALQVGGSASKSERQFRVIGESEEDSYLW